VAEFERLMGQLGGTDGKSGLLGYAATIADRTGDGSRIRALAPQFTALRHLHSQVRDKDDGGAYAQAVALSVGTSNDAMAASFGETGPGARCRRRAAGCCTTSRSQVRLAGGAGRTHRFGVLEVAIPVFAISPGCWCCSARAPHREYR
jgi:hypothetical protein